MRKQAPIEPFWNRMPRFFLYGFTPPVLYVLVGLALINALLLDYTVTVQGGHIGAILVTLLTFLFSQKYGFHILERTAHGHAGGPPLDRDTLLDHYEMPFKLIGMWIVLVVVGGALALLVNPVLLIPYVLLVSLLLPGMLMTLAIENSMTQALNPAALVRLALSIGWPYFLTVGLFLLLNGGAGTVMGLFGQALPAGARAFLGGLSQHYFWFVNMHLLGYLVYQYHERVGFSPDALAEQDDGWGDVLAPVEEHIEAGQYEAAADRLKAMLPEYPDHAIWLRQKRHTVLKLTERTNQLLDNGGKLLAALVDANRMREATEVYIDLTDIDPGVRPGRETDYEPLLDMLVQRGEYQRAVRMANGFHKDFPGSQSIPPLYLQVARIFLEFLDQPAKARQIAEFLIRRFPDHPAATRARALRDAVTT
jgi:hypothetical protein